MTRIIIIIGIYLNLKKKIKRKVILKRIRKNHTEKRKLTLEENNMTIRSNRKSRANLEIPVDYFNQRLDSISVVNEQPDMSEMNTMVKNLDNLDSVSIRTATNQSIRMRKQKKRPHLSSLSTDNEFRRKSYDLDAVSVRTASNGTIRGRPKKTRRHLQSLESDSDYKHANAARDQLNRYLGSSSDSLGSNSLTDSESQVSSRKESLSSLEDNNYGDENPNGNNKMPQGIPMTRIDNRPRFHLNSSSSSSESDTDSNSQHNV